MNDRIRRWMVAEDTFRVLVAHSTGTVARAADIAGTAPPVTSLYGRLLTGTTLFQLAQAPIFRVQCAIHHDGPAGVLLADVWPGPVLRGYVEDPRPANPQVLGNNPLLRLSRQLPQGAQIYESVVPLRSDNIADALQQYMAESEQVLTLFSLETTTDHRGQVLMSGGMIIQAMPDSKVQHLATVTSCLETTSFDALLRQGYHPFQAFETIFANADPHWLGDDPLEYRCRCSKHTAIRAVMALDPETLCGIRTSHGTEMVACNFCGQEYRVSAQDLPPED